MAVILVVEDEEVLAKNVRRTIERMGHEVSWAPTGAEAEALFNDLHPQLTLLDLRLPDANGLDILQKMRERDPSANVLMMTAFASVEDAVRAIKLGACDYLQKPIHLEDLKHAVDRSLKETQLRQEVTYYRERESRDSALDGMIGDHPAIEQLKARIQRLCSLPPTAAPPTVLVTGETGTGKGLVARILHYNGPRAGQPFIEVNCAAIPENLVEAELFGHERGAFTDAKTAKPGLFQAADGGTLFLDEIGCLTPAVQSKILKALEERKVRPVGGRAERTVDIQIVGATNRPLEELVREGTFREDLYYRLQVAPLTVPPLRERGDDIVRLARTFVAEIASRYRLGERRLSPQAEDCLRAYRWPGNVRELRNLLDRALLFSDEPVLGPAALGLPTTAAAPAAAATVPAPPSAGLQKGPDGGFEVVLPEEGVKFEDVERSLIIAAMDRTKGNQSEAARLLGLSRDTLRYRLEKFGIATAS